MARGQLTPQDLAFRKQISDNINRYLSEKGVSQTELSEHTGIPKSTISGYVKGTSTPAPGNIQKMADYFDIPKSRLDPRYASQKVDQMTLNKSEEHLITLFRKNTDGMNAEEQKKFSDSLDDLMGFAKQFLDK